MANFNFDKKIIKRVFLIIASIFFVILGVTNLLFDFSLNFLNESFNYSLLNLGFSSTLKISAGVFDFLKGFGDIIDKIFNFFLAINFLILFQITFLKLSNLIVVKIFIVSTFLLSFIPSVRRYSVKIFVILLFLNPGLSLYVSGVKLISDSINLELGKNVSDKFKELDETVKNNKLIDETKRENEEKKSNEEAKDFFKSPFKSIFAGLQDKLNSSIKYISTLLQTVMELVIIYLVNSVIIFFVLPVFYFYCLYILAKKIFRVAPTIEKTT